MGDTPEQKEQYDPIRSKTGLQDERKPHIGFAT